MGFNSSKRVIGKLPQSEHLPWENEWIEQATGLPLRTQARHLNLPNFVSNGFSIIS